MIKLQMVLRPAWYASGDDDEVKSQLAQLGISQTGRGLATLSAEIPAHTYKQLWGELPTIKSGFAVALEGQDLSVPPSLAHAVASIMTVPRHTTFDGE
jgi:hypothetical protein